MMALVRCRYSASQRRSRIHSRLPNVGKQPVLRSETVFDPKSRNGSAIAFLRVCVGIFFLIFGQYKVFGTQFTMGGGFQSWINRFLTYRKIKNSPSMKA